MKLPGYVCVTCEKPFSRKWNIKRHISTQHPRQPVQPVTFIDYLAGRQTGIYKNMMEPPVPDQNEGGTDVTSSYLQVLNPMYGPLFRRGLKSLTSIKNTTNADHVLAYLRQQDEQKPKNADTLMDIFTREFLSGFARQVVKWNLSQLNQRPPYYGQQILPQSYRLSNFLIPSGDRANIFGFRTHVCPECLVLQHLAVSYPKKMQSTGGTAAEIRHVCQPMLIASNLDLDKEAHSKSVLMMQENSPSYLKFIVDLWTEKQVVLVAIEVPSCSGSLIATSKSDLPEANGDHISITNPRNPNTSISFHISREKKVQLNPRNSPDIPRHWSLRVMQNKQTNLSGAELLEFLNLVKNATFGIFNIYLFNEERDRINNNTNHHERGQQKYRDKQVPTVRSLFMYLTCNE